MTIKMNGENASPVEEKIDVVEVVAAPLEREEEAALKEASNFRDKVIATKVNDRIHSEVIEKATKLGITPSQYIRMLINRDRRQARPKLAEDMSRKDSVETEGALIDYLDELELAKDEILEKLRDIQERRAPSPKVDTSAKEALDCVMEVLQKGQIANPLYEHSFTEEMTRSARNGSIGKEEMAELCDVLSKVYEQRITPSTFATTDFIDLAKKTNPEKTE